MLLSGVSANLLHYLIQRHDMVFRAVFLLRIENNERGGLWGHSVRQSAQQLIIWPRALLLFGKPTKPSNGILTQHEFGAAKQNGSQSSPLGIAASILSQAQPATELS
jgi:hypothetical protein